ncbi:UNVERIFIED_CONTAM: hypothetical protein FKN15_060851 [Acipenser sinensis]
MSSVFQRYLALASQVLSWNFLPPNYILLLLYDVLHILKPAEVLAVVDLDFGLLGRHYIAMFESSQNVMLKPTESWRDTFLDSRVMELFFTVHRKIREDSDMAQDSLQCLAQLASMHGPVFPDESAQLDKDDMVYMEAYDKLLESWLTLVQDEKHFHKGFFIQHAVQVFNSYIQCHLAAPEGTRNLTVNGVASREEEEISELQEDDRELFSDQLASIGMLGRIAADHCIPLLTSLLEDRVTRLHGQLQRHQQHLLASPGSGSVENKVLDDLYEDIHWLILVTEKFKSKPVVMVVIDSKVEVDGMFKCEISIPFSAAFGADTEGAQWIVGYILEKVINNLSVWSSEPDLANDTVELLVTLVERRER